MAVLWKQLRYSTHLIFHPFDGFWDLKHEHRGSIKAALVILAMLVIHSILSTQFTGFLYNPDYDGVSLNVFSEFASVIGTFLLWCIANWSLTTLMDGEGRFSDIVMVSAYALVPLFLIGIPLTFISNAMPLEYAAFYNIINVFTYIWFSDAQRIDGCPSVHVGKDDPDGDPDCCRNGGHRLSRPLVLQPGFSAGQLRG